MRARRIAVILGAGALLGLATLSGRAGEPSPEDRVKVGKDLFVREWVPNDPRARGGDGLGPVYNANSCVACHFAGGVGGAGPNDRNAVIVTASMTLEKDENPEKVPMDDLFRAHPAFKASRSVVLHREGVQAGYAAWKRDLTSRVHGRFRMTTTSRNTPALFGAGLIDAIPDSVLEKKSVKLAPEFPEIQGRVSRLATGKIGRFGWKGQTASLDDFVRTACAVELGLEVPGHPQTPDPERFEDKSPGLDLTNAECSALTAYLAALPKPATRPPFDQLQAQSVRTGRAEFETIGCASCHSPTLGHVDGLYSDLLLHDMGESLRDSAIYYGTPVPPAAGTNFAAADAKAKPATAVEWRTPPLWGVRDSGPYLHDGRAMNLDQAIRAHSGEANATRLRYESLRIEERTHLIAFLNSLGAPKPVKAPAASTHRTSGTRLSDARGAVGIGAGSGSFQAGRPIAK